MSGINRRVGRNGAKKAHKSLTEAWKIAKRVQLKKLKEAESEGRPLSDEEKQQFVPNGRLIGRRPTFKQFVETKMHTMMNQKIKAENEKYEPVTEPAEEVDLSWEDKE